MYIRGHRALAALIACWSIIDAAAPVSAIPLPSGISAAQVEDRTYLSYATEVIDNLIQYGTDRYGSVQTNDILVANLDVRTKDNPTAAELGAADEQWRAQRRQRRSPGGTGFLMNQPVYSAMKRLSQVSGDNTYSTFVDANLAYMMANHVDSNGLIWWGWHRHVNVHTDEELGETPEDGGTFHEMHRNILPLWEDMWNQNSSVVETQIESIWQRHVIDKSTGEVNRHDIDDEPCGLAKCTFSFIESAGAFVEGFAFMQTQQPGQIPGESNPNYDTWQERADLVAGFAWDHRGPTTNLIPHTPGGIREEAFYTSTHSTGSYSAALLHAYDLTGNTVLRDQALTFMNAWGTYAYSAANETFWSAVSISDGTPTSSEGLLDPWRPEMITGFQDLAQAFAEAYQTHGDPALLTTAERWAKVYRNSLPANFSLFGSNYDGYSQDWAEHGTYAEHYGRLVDFFVTMYEVTSDGTYLLSAREVAKEAVSKLWYDGLFRGHPNKPYYESYDGVGELLEALIDLDQQSANFPKFGDFDGDGDVDDDDFNSYVRPNMLTAVDYYTNGDVTGDGYVGIEDFDRFKHEHYEGTSALSLAVPEPNTFALLLAATPAWLLLRSSARSLRRSI